MPLGPSCMGRDRQNENRTDQFAKWVRSETQLPAWQSLSGTAQAAYMHVKVRCRTEGKNLKHNNNGSVGLSARTLAKEMGCNARTAMSALADLQAKGWITCTKRHQMGFDGRAFAPEWRLTMAPTTEKGVHKPPTYEPKSWTAGQDYEVVEYLSSKRPGHATGDVSRFQKNKVTVRKRSAPRT